MPTIQRSRSGKGSPPHDGLALLRDQLESVRDTGELSYDALCPAHDDASPSLSVGVGDNGKVVLHCHAGCDPADVLSAVGLEWADLDPIPVIEAVYRFERCDGSLAYEEVRYLPKDFRVRRPDPKRPGHTIWNLRGVEPLPYGLPELGEALASGETVFVVEGPKDADNLRSTFGLVATTNHGGAGKWTEQHSSYFVGSRSRVVIVADRDSAGHKHALAVQQSLFDVAHITAEIVLPAIEHPHADSSDHIAAGHGIDDFLAVTQEGLSVLVDGPQEEGDLHADHAEKVIEQIEWLSVQRDARIAFAAADWAPPDSPGSLAEQLAKPVEPLVMLVEELAFVGANIVINAAAKSGKTTLILNVIHSILGGDPLFGRFAVAPLPNGRTVAWWNAELTERQALNWLRDMDMPYPENFYPLHLRGYSMAFDAPQVEEWAVTWLAVHKVAVWVLDPKSALFTGEENSATETGAWLAAIDRIKRRAGVETLFLVHHASEASDMDDPDDNAVRLVRGRGSTRMEGWADVLWSWVGRFDQPRYLSALGRDVDVAPFGGISLQPDTRALRWDGRNSTPSADRRLARATEAYDLLVAAGLPLQATDLQNRMSGAKPSTKRQGIDYGVERGYIRRWTGAGNRTLHEPGDLDPRHFRVAPRADGDPSANQ